MVTGFAFNGEKLFFRDTQWQGQRGGNAGVVAVQAWGQCRRSGNTGDCAVRIMEGGTKEIHNGSITDL